MINTILDNFRDDLFRYRQNKQAPYLSEAGLLIHQIDHIDTLENLLIQLEHNPRDLRVGFFSFLTNTTSSDNFFMIQRQRLREDILARLQASQEVTASLSQLVIPVEAQGLMDTIHAVLMDKRNLLHHRAAPLLTYLSDPQGMQAIINHLSRLPIIPAPVTPFAGSFDASSWLNEKHSACLGLLRSNAARYQSTDSSGRANQLLQTLLIIEHDMHTPSSYVEEIAEFKSDDDPFSCIMM